MCLRVAMFGLYPGWFVFELVIDFGGRRLILDLALQIGDVVRQDTDEFPSLFTGIAQEFNVVSFPTMLIKGNLAISPIHTPSPLRSLRRTRQPMALWKD